ncbi:MAG: hypothetical protein K2K11_04010 [Bacteroidales bacterium]|nr:hypothetical protein [Bacteroidales bacterium]
MVECTTRDVIRLLMERNDMQMEDALDKVYNSRTYENLQNEKSGLYIQSPEYVYEELMHEVHF